MNRKTGKILIIIGLLMLLAAFCLTTYNIWSAHNAQKESENIVAQIKANTEAVSDKEYLFNPYMKMPSINIDGHEYIGIIEIPALGLTLPVMSDWDYPSLKISPCRYKGSIYSGDMIIAAHNYRGHFGKIKNLNAGDEMIFTDVKKQVHV